MDLPRSYEVIMSNISKYTNSSGKVIGKIVHKHTISNPTTKLNDVYLTVAIGKIGCITVSQYEDITDEMIKAHAEYRRECIKVDIENLKEQLKNIDESLEELGIVGNQHDLALWRKLFEYLER